MYCQVIVDIVHENVARPFTYRIPDGLNLCRGQRVSVPFGHMQKEGIVLSCSEETDVEEKKVREVTAALEPYAAIPPELMDLAEEMARRNHCPLAETLRLMLPAQMRGGRIREKKEKWVSLIRSPQEAAAEAEKSRKKRKLKRAELLELLESQGSAPVKALAERVRDPLDALRKLEADGWIQIREQETLRTPQGAFGPKQSEPPALTEGQEEALEEILPALKQGRGAFLLHGVTGSGKTEVFLAAVRRTLEMG